MIPLDTLPDRPYAVLGLGRSGLVACQALAAAGRTVWAWDDNTAARQTAALAGVPLSDPDDWDLGAAEALVLSPGIPRHFPVPHAVVQRADAAGVSVIGDIELFAKAAPYAHCIGITGTNGKSTTTSLIGHILQEARFATHVGGNLGVPVLDLTPLPEDGIYVLEISSYQLDITPSLHLDVAILLNIAPDHLDRHGGFAGYIASKKKIFSRCAAGDTAVVGIDDEPSREIHKALAGGQPGCRVIPVSMCAPVPRGVFVEEGRLMDAIDGGEPIFVMDLARAAALPGSHNAQNAAAAYAAARSLGVDRESIAQATMTFPGLAHRQERVALVEGVLYVNDSKATNPDAAARALACYRSIYWIAGGRGKEGGFDAVTPHLHRVNHAFVFGEAAEDIAGFLALKDIPTTRCRDLSAAVEAARRMAEPEGAAEPVVLLSPMCASLDQFANFEQRGDTFRAAVEALA